MLLADIGNTHIHLYDGRKVVHLSHQEGIDIYGTQQLYYISVNRHMNSKIEALSGWQDIASFLRLEGAYETMGVDRKALCMSHPEGLFVDAGSAITVDSVRAGYYEGGYIFPGLTAMQKAYAVISPVLDVPLNTMLCLERLPTTTKDGISYGIIASIKALIEQHQDGKPLYFTGGDGAFLASFFDGAVYDETLVFRGMREALKNKG